MRIIKALMVTILAAEGGGADASDVGSPATYLATTTALPTTLDGGLTLMVPTRGVVLVALFACMLK